MLPQTLTRPSESQTSTDDELSHIVCEGCYPDDDDPDAVTLCGAPIDGATHWCPEDLSCGCLPCVVCDDLYRAGYCAGRDA